MRIGLYLAYWPWFSADEQIELARRAGLDSVWVAEAWGQDVVSVLGHLSAVTERIGLGLGAHADPGAHASGVWATALCCRPGELGERLAAYEGTGATSLLAMPFGERPAIVDALGAAASAR